MKKKLIFAMSAIVALFATSCQEEDFGANTGATSTVAFTVSTPEIASRAYSDGTTATVLQYAVYNAAGEELTDLTVTDATINGSAKVDLQLTTGNTYSVIFWAAAPNAPYTVDFANKAMTVNYTNAVSNDEARDAFYKYHTFTVTGAQTETIELKRPFAQLNIGTNDYEASKKAGYTPVNSSVTVKNIYNTLNLETGVVSDEVEAEFALAEIKKDEKFPVENNEYLAMNYLLVGADKEVIDIEFTYADANNDAKTRSVGSVPVQRNYRTNIYGQLLTSDVDIIVEIEPAFNETAHEADALHKAAAFGGEVTLTEDVVLTSTLNVQSNMTINLNGKTISGNLHKNDGAIIKNTATLTIIGGTISSLADNGGSAVLNNGTMIIKDATLNGAPNANGSWPSYTVNNTGKLTISNSTITSYHGSVASYGDDAVVTMNNTNIDMTGIQGFTSHGIYTYSNGKVIVNGGKIVNKATDQAASGASVINGAVEVNAGDFSGRIENYYGTPVIKGGVFSVKPNASFIAAGYKAVESNGKYVVVAENVAEDVAVVSTADQLNKALLEGNSNIVLTAGEYTFPDDAQGKTLSIIGTGNPADVVVNAHNDGAGEGNCDYCFHSSNVTFENVTIKTDGTYFPGYAYMEGTFNNCIINGVYAVYKSSSFNNCTFNVEGDLYNLWTWGGEEVTLNNCTFNCHGKAVLLYGTVNTELTVNNCTFNDNGNDAVTGKAAIEIGNDYNKSYTLTVNNATVNGFAINPDGFNTGTTLWANKNKMPADKLTVTVDGENAYKAVVSTGDDFKAALSAGNNIVLTGNVEINKIDLTSNTQQDIVIDGNGNTITTADSYGVEVTAGKNITLKNAKVEITKEGDYITYAAGFKIANGDYAGMTIKLENCEIRMANTDWAYAVNMPASVNNLNLVIDNCTLEGAVALQCWGDNNTITVTNSKLICNYTTSAQYTSYCVALQGDSYNYAENNTLKISGCEFSYSGVDNFNSVIRSAADVPGKNTIEVSDCTYGEKVKQY